ncbi:hypothetical protein C8R48DRAFT_674012 [Suillus tomentosus]|nr:hypothetical protein C8R48DRAFT_674012 [Suillus tomentosus]
MDGSDISIHQVFCHLWINCFSSTNGWVEKWTPISRQMFGHSRIKSEFVLMDRPRHGPDHPSYIRSYLNKLLLLVTDGARHGGDKHRMQHPLFFHQTVTMMGPNKQYVHRIHAFSEWFMAIGCSIGEDRGRFSPMNHISEIIFMPAVGSNS